jgi:hypothetical protein
MSDEAIKLGVRESFRLVKWDASVGDNPPDPSVAQGHPACVEIWELTPGEPAKQIYQRDMQWH